MSDVPPPPPPPDGRGDHPPPPPPPPPPPDLTPPEVIGFHRSPVPDIALRRVRTLSVAIVVFTALSIVATAASTVLTPAASDRAGDFLDGRITEDEFLEGFAAVGATQFAQSIATLVTAVLTMIWMYRIATNVRGYARTTTWAPLFAVFGWVLPPILVVIPFLMLRELWKASSPYPTHGDDDWRSTPDNPAIWVWFLLYGVLQTVLVIVQNSSLLASGLSDDATSLAESIDDAGAFTLAAGLVVVASGIAWIVVVRQLTARHMILTDERR